ncbi:MAG: BON domain-containing protein [Pyrinomonadaceae bacterium]
MLNKLFALLTFAAGFAVVFVAPTFAQVSMNGGKTRIEREVRSEILSLPYYGVFDAIGYKADGGTVTLTGYATRPTTKEAAENSVKDIEGVTKVVNNIEVLSALPADYRIRRQTLRALSGGGRLMYYFLGTNPSIRIIVNDGKTILEGYVDNEADKNLANILARGVPGTFGVTNNLQIVGKAG